MDGTIPREAVTLRHVAEQSLIDALGEDIVSHGPAHDRTRPSQVVFKRISDKWSLLVLGQLRERPLRFTEVLETLPGVSSRMLVATLRSLERDGFVTRTIYAEVPPRVEYGITELGRSLLPELHSILVWAYSHYAEISENRRRYDNEH